MNDFSPFFTGHPPRRRPGKELFDPRLLRGEREAPRRQEVLPHGRFRVQARPHHRQAPGVQPGEDNVYFFIYILPAHKYNCACFMQKEART